MTASLRRKTYDHQPLKTFRHDNANNINQAKMHQKHSVVRYFIYTTLSNTYNDSKNENARTVMFRKSSYSQSVPVLKNICPKRPNMEKGDLKIFLQARGSQNSRIPQRWILACHGNYVTDRKAM